MRWISLLALTVAAAQADVSGALAWNEKARVALEGWRLHPDPALLNEAGQAIEASRQALAANPLATKYQAQLHLARGQFREALETAHAFNQATPDELDGYRLIVEACLALGCYEEAEKAGQWMLDLRAKDPATLRTAAKLRELWGDFEGAMDFLAQALQRIQPQQIADRAAALAHMARIERAQGHRETARKLAEEASAIAPRMPLADGESEVYEMLSADQKQPALRLAEQQMQSRQDVGTRTAYAWALFANDQPQPAWEQMRKVLAVGTRDAVLFYRAGCIAFAAGHKAEARKLWSKSLELDAHSPVAADVERRLNE